MDAYERVEELPAALRRPLADWLLALADNKRLLGLRYAEWCTGAPELEADVALSAMAQYELGHARLLHGVLSSMAEDPRDEARELDPAAWRSLPALDRPAAGWPEVVALNAVLDTLLTVNMRAAAEGNVGALAQRLRKAVSEERYHSLHARAWLRRLGTAPEAIVKRTSDAVAALWTQCLAWFGPPAEDNALDRLAAAGVLAAGASALRDRFLDAAAEIVVAPFELPARRLDGGWRLQLQIDWRAWNETSRRHGTPEFDEDSFAMLTGAHARALGVSD